MRFSARALGPGGRGLPLSHLGLQSLHHYPIIFIYKQVSYHVSKMQLLFYKKEIPIKQKMQASQLTLLTFGYGHFQNKVCPEQGLKLRLDMQKRAFPASWWLYPERQTIAIYHPLIAPSSMLALVSLALQPQSPQALTFCSSGNTDPDSSQLHHPCACNIEWEGRGEERKREWIPLGQSRANLID